MKKIYFAILFLALGSTINAQEFAKQLTEAKTAYAAGKLDDARFAMQQMLQEIDIITGKDIIKNLPGKNNQKSLAFATNAAKEPF